MKKENVFSAEPIAEPKSYRIAAILVLIYYVAAAVYISVNYILEENLIRILLGPVSLLFLLVFPLAERILKIKLGTPLRLCTLLFCNIAFQYGVALRWYSLISFYDNFAHVLSGIFFTLLGFCLFARYNGTFEGRRKSVFFQNSYAFFFSMFIAVVWEIGEFIGFLLTGHDMQHHLDTGVFDTMEDIIACFIGSLVLCADFSVTAKTGKKMPFSRVILAFDRENGYAKDEF